MMRVTIAPFLSGVSWAWQTSAGERVWSFVASSADGTILAAVVYQGNILISLDSGLTWNEQVRKVVRDRSDMQGKDRSYRLRKRDPLSHHV